MVKRNKFGVELPSDSDPRWQRTQFQISPEFVQNALPIGSVLHPSGWAIMNDYNLWREINNEREILFQQEREVRLQKEKEEERLRKIEEKKIKEEQKELIKQQQKIQSELDKLQSKYDREIRNITREVNAQYNPLLNNLQKKLKDIKKLIK